MVNGRSELIHSNPRGNSGAASLPVNWRLLMASPEFPVGLEWVNTDRALTKADLAGKIVILDFWTYC